MIFLTNWGPTLLAAIGGIMVVAATVWSSIQQDRLQQALQQKTEEIVGLTTDSMNLLQGGDSYPILSPAMNDIDSTVSFSLHNDGKYPIYDLDLYISEDGNAQSAVIPSSKHFDVLGAGKEETGIYTTVLSKGIKEKQVVVVTSARNGETRQIYKCFRSTGSLCVRTEVYRGGKLIKTE